MITMSAPYQPSFTLTSAMFATLWEASGQNAGEQVGSVRNDEQFSFIA